MSEALDAIVVGSGPNGLAAAIEIAGEGHSVRVIEASDVIGGGLRTEELTLPGFVHDRCSAIHPMARLSPFFRDLDLAPYGLEWRPFDVSVAHPLDDGPTPILSRSRQRDGERLGADGQRLDALLEPFLEAEPLFESLLGPAAWPARPLLLARFARLGLGSALRLARRHLRTAAGRALLGGCAGHSILPLERAGSAAFGLVFALAGRLVDWPCARGGSAAIATALAARLRELGGTVETGRPVRDLGELPRARVVLLDLAPATVARLGGSGLPPGYRARMRRYRYGPGVFKLDWALDGPIPWRDPVAGQASTVHLGGTLEEIAASERDAWRGKVAERPFLIVCQQSTADPGRAPAGKHTGYAYCHVPNGCEVDMTAAVEAQIERFAPGFRQRILARRATAPRHFERLNPNNVGGAVTGGAAILSQTVARPTWRWRPYTTPNPRLFLCSASTPPGGGVHGMCGVHAARAALRRLRARGGAH